MKFFGCNYVVVCILFAILTISASASASKSSFYDERNDCIMKVSGIIPIAAELSANYCPIVTGFAGAFGNFAGFATTSLMVFLLKDRNQGIPSK